MDSLRSEQQAIYAELRHLQQRVQRYFQTAQASPEGERSPQDTASASTSSSTSVPAADDYQPFPPPRQTSLSSSPRVPLDDLDSIPDRLTAVTYAMPHRREPASAATSDTTFSDQDWQSAQLEEAWQRFETQIRHVNHLADQQETALVDLWTVAEEVSVLWHQGSRLRDRPPMIPLAVDPALVGVPQVTAGGDGLWQLTPRSLDERYRSAMPQPPSDRAYPRPIQGDRVVAPQTAVPEQSLFSDSRSSSQPTSQSTSQPASRSSSRPKPPARLADHPGWQIWMGLLSVGRSLQAGLVRLHQQQRRRHRFRTTTPQLPVLDLQGAALWIVGAAIARVILAAAQAAWPSLQPLWLMLMVVPAAIAVFRVTLAPQTGFVTAYRLTLIVIGLLIGGRI
ncbi:MAG: hypothetical protein EA367_16980 [Leptolyngbya sp. DLM2.Bin15]|nr:MAG: hypothetical protein EA367_16980 [Leptolyngbya sp. DLM2.Bin15]